MGDDLAIVNAARVSYGKTHDHVDESDRGLIGYLARYRHGTPFEMVVFKFRVHVPISVAREWQRHRIGSFNEISTRYVEMLPEFYIPEPEAVRVQTGKPGHYTMEPATRALAEQCKSQMAAAYERSYETYKALLIAGVAKELARNVLPLGMYTEFIWSVNLRALFNFLSLRTADNALYEIRVEAKAVEELISSVVPIAHTAWNTCGRTAL